MTPEFVMTLGQDALALMLLVSAPLLAIILVIGLVVSIFQALTQINEATLSFVPKLVAAIVVLAMAGPWMLSTLVDYIRRTIEMIPALVQ
ncbi:flagellar biosynthesis protein FliQ [Pseudorhodoferax soli]|uniref:Flagellar biosynthetic protein FliQ n=1 Tax=Pseudorhodoferax soli TaxID=545864 RepID=A0A368XE59_9BURK|nr:flagellar biosynthesis protein FliQ [Pseudorhodoferax soli]RCW66155.1 flagellar biosynthetic protein FliQ [Pseudorhodoferax soli]